MPSCRVDVARFDVFPSVVIRNVRFAVGPGDAALLSGATGSGKSSIIRLLARSATGRRPAAVIDLGPRAEIGGGVVHEGVPDNTDVSLLMQEPSASRFAATPNDDAIIVAINQGDPDAIRWRMICESVGNPKEFGKPWRHLSGGWQQLAAMCIACSADRSVYIFDEPTANLDDCNAVHAVSLLRWLRNEERTVILSSHSIGELGGVITTKVPEWAIERRDTRPLVTLLEAASEWIQEMAPAELEARDLHVVLEGRSILRDCNVTVRAGEIVDVVGANGSGKSTLVRAMAGVQSLKEGSVRILPRQRLRSTVSVSPQSPRFALLGRTVGEDLELYFGGRRKHAVRDLRGWANRGTEALSQGEAKLVSMVLAVLARPIVLLDEPFGGLDADVSALAGDFLQLARRVGRAILLVRPSGDAFFSWASRWATVVGGAVVARGEGQDFAAKPA